MSKEHKEYTVRRVGRPARGGRNERGLIIVYFALFLTVLLIASAFAVDVGAWYDRAEKMQRAADAAALAGAPYLPDNPALAVSTAVSVAATDGFSTGGTVSVTAAQVSGQPRQLQVDINDSKLKQYISQTFYSGTSAHRHAVAVYAPPLQLGSPQNRFGTGTAFDDTPNNFWAAVDGYCSPREQGDLLLAHSDGQWTSSTASWDCGTHDSIDAYHSSYDKNGYNYQISVPPGHDTLAVQLYDPAYVPYWFPDHGSRKLASKYCAPDPYNPNAVAPDTSPNGTWPNSPTFNFETDYTLTDPSGGLVQSKAFASIEKGVNTTTHADSTYCNQFYTLYTIPSGAAPGVYTLNVKTAKDSGDQNSFGSNAFGIVVVPSVGGVANTTYQCTSIPGSTSPPYSATCPQIYGSKYMSVIANSAGTTGGRLYLAKIDKAYADRDLTIKLWDPGEGSQTLKIRDNGGNPVDFHFTIDPCTNFQSPPGPTIYACPATAPTDNAVSGTDGLNVSGTGANNQLDNRYDDTKLGCCGTFNSRMLTITVHIDPNYDDTANGGWWSIDYSEAAGTSVQDRTTWSVSVPGSPLHLLKG